MTTITFSDEAMDRRYAQLIRAVIDLSDTYFYAGRLDEAVQLPEQTLALMREGDADEVDETRLLLHYGKMLAKMSFYRQAQFERAYDVLARAQKMARDLGDDTLRGMARLRLGQLTDYQTIYTGASDFQVALNHYERACDLLSAAGNDEGRGKAVFGKGLIYQRLGQLPEARAHFEQALEIAEKNDLKYDKSLAIRHIGFVHFAEGDLDKACAYAQESLALREEIGCQVLLASAHHVLGSISIASEEWPEAIAHLQQADALAQEMDLRFIRIMTLLSMGEWYKRQNDPERAREYFQLARDIAEESGHVTGKDAATADLAQLEIVPG
ncbi:MAG: tetratricopeptide repeat protein [Chloroflexota bacterium]|jgi:tetratricopeptide (TPR) repeat protein